MTDKMEADKMLDVYILDYLVKKNFYASAETFQAEAKVSDTNNTIDTPGGFLFEWWAIFWDVFIAKHKSQGTGTTECHNKGQLQPQRHRKLQKNQQQQVQIQQVIQQKQVQQQKRRQEQQQQVEDVNVSHTLRRQNSGIANAMPEKIVEDSKLAVQKDGVDNAIGMLLDDVGQFPNSNHTAVMESVAIKGLPSGQTSKCTSGARTLHSVNNPFEQLPIPAQEMDNLINPTMNLRAANLDSLMVGVHGPSHAVSNLPLKGWPLMGLDQLQPGFHQHQKSLQSLQAVHQLQLQRQLVLQANQNLASSSANDLECIKLKMLLSNEIPGIRKNDLLNGVGDIRPVKELPWQGALRVLSCGDTDMLLKQQLLASNQVERQHSQTTLFNDQPQTLDVHRGQEDVTVTVDNVAINASLSNTSREDNQFSKTHIGTKRKQSFRSCGPANSSGTANTTGQSWGTAPSTPSTHTTGDVISMPGIDGTHVLSSEPNEKVDVDHFMDDASLDDNIDSFYSHTDEVRENVIGRRGDAKKGLEFSEIGSFQGSAIDCCHFSSDGKLLATGGHDEKAVLWCVDSQKKRSTLEEHSHAITDIRFNSSTSQLATSSLDRTVKIWDVDSPSYSLQTFIGHSASVMSLDIHPNKEDLICSCDDVSEIRYWSIKNGGCTGVLKVNATQVRFQPGLGRYLAAVARSGVSVIDLDTTQTCGHPLKGHAFDVESVCWDASGEYLASLSKESIRVWRIGSGVAQDCIHDLSIPGKKLRCCVFHPRYASLLVVGCHESLELWNMAENKMMTAFQEPVISLTASEVGGLVASASGSSIIKLWK